MAAVTTTCDELTALMLERGVAYTFVPQISLRGDDSWVAHYPAADWSVIGASREDALARLHDAALERRGTRNENVWQIVAVQNHLANGPVAGVYEIPLDVNERIMNSADPQAALDEVIEKIDSERAAAR
jgi:hypothetical protein